MGCVFGCGDGDLVLSDAGVRDAATASEDASEERDGGEPDVGTDTDAGPDAIDGGEPATDAGDASDAGAASDGGSAPPIGPDPGAVPFECPGGGGITNLVWDVDTDPRTGDANATFTTPVRVTFGNGSAIRRRMQISGFPDPSDPEGRGIDLLVVWNVDDPTAPPRSGTYTVQILRYCEHDGDSLLSCNAGDTDPAPGASIWETIFPVRPGPTDPIAPTLRIDTTENQLRFELRGLAELRAARGEARGNVAVVTSGSFECRRR